MNNLAKLMAALAELSVEQLRLVFLFAEFLAEKEEKIKHTG